MGGDYGGVWHLNETNGMVRAEDSAKLVADADNALYPFKGNQSWTDFSTATGVVGVARSTAQTHCLNGNILVCSNVDACAFGKIYTVSGWSIAPSNMYAACYNKEFHGFTLYSRPTWELNCNITNGAAKPYGGYYQLQYGSKLYFGDDDFYSWLHIAIVGSASETLCYTNGVLCGQIKNAGYGDGGIFTIGGTYGITNGLGGTRWTMLGHWDEQRYLGATASADWIRAEYDTVKNVSFVTASEKGDTPSCSLTVTATMPEYGTTATDPVYGNYILQAGVAKTCTAPTSDTEVTPQRFCGYDGWTLYRLDGTEWVAVDSNDNNVCTFTPANKTTMKLVWNVVYKRSLTLSTAGDGAGSMTLGGSSVTPGTVCLAEGTYELAVVPDANSSFAGWNGNVEHLSDMNAATTLLDLSAPCSIAANLASGSRVPRTLEWSGASGGNLMDAAGWGGAMPGPGDTLYVTNAGDSVVMNCSTPRFAKIVVGGGPGAATLVCTNWMARLCADTVEVADQGTIAAVGALTDGEASNRVWIAADTLTVATGGIITASSAGYKALNGPAWVGASKNVRHEKRFNKFGGAYGGAQAYPARDTSDPGDEWFATYVPPHVYGSVEWPYDPGCGPGTEGANNAGGGAIFLDVTGTVTVDGTVEANASSTKSGWSDNSNYYLPYGSGGGIVIRCAAIAGSGAVRANGGGTLDSTGYARASGGAGGRIAVHYDPAEQAAADCTVRFEALGFAGGCAEQSVDNARGRPCYPADPGTLWFTDNRFLTDAKYLAAALPLAGEWHSGVALSSLHYDASIACSNALLKFVQEGFDFSVAGSVDWRMPSATYRANEVCGLWFTNATVSVAGDLTLTGARLTMAGGTLSVGGSVTLAPPGAGNEFYRGGVLHVTAAPTNAPDCFGARVEVGNKLELGSWCYVYAMAHPDNGAIPYFHTRHLVVGGTSWFTAERGGWGPYKGPGYASTAGSYGGRAGRFDDLSWDYSKAGPTYGSESKPLDPGSGGGFDRGGGVIYVMAEKSIEVKSGGYILADSRDCTGAWSGYVATGSGGGILLKTRKIFGEGTIRAASGNYGSWSKNGYHGSGPGGGGRIAIHCWMSRSVTNELTVTAPGGSDNAYHKAAESGTVWWGEFVQKGLTLFVR